jgi:hypothetical protein
MGELITERIRRNARELKLYGLADTADELVDRAKPASSATASSLTSSSKARSACSKAAATPPG